MKRVAILAAHFVPSNLAAVHRARLWSLHLREFGWEPIVVTAHPDYYEEPLEWELEALLPADLKIIQTRAIPVKPLRIVGDVGFRAFFWQYRELVRLASSHEIDFLHITIPSNFSGPLGRLVHEKTGLPYGIDYIDPWVHEFPGSDAPFTKAWLSAGLARILEPWSVRKAAVITGITPGYYAGMMERNPGIRDRAVFCAMPYGGSELDHQYATRNPRPAHLFSPHAGKFNLIYAGAMLPHGYEVLDSLLKGLALLRQRKPELAQQFHLHFVGTGKSVTDPGGFNVLPLVRTRNLEDCVSEYPARLPYLDVLSHLHAASGNLVFGSTEPHYSPSKLFQAVISRRPVFALLHEASEAVPIFQALNAGTLITLTPSGLPTPQVIAQALDRFIFQNTYSDASVNWTILEQFSARASARALAAALDKALANQASASRVCA
jgi:hypothetical protein